MSNKLLYGISLMAVIWLFAMIFAVAHGTDLSVVFINSDTMYQPSLYWDLVENGNSISDWNLNAAPNFFPDMLFYFMLMKLTGNLLVSSFLFALIQVLVINLLFTQFLKHLTQDYLKLMLLVNGVFVLFACTRLISRDFGFVFHFISNSFHLGSFVMMLIAVNIMLSYMTNPKRLTLTFLFLTIVVGCISDRLLLVNFVVPAVVAVLFFIKSPAIKKVIPLVSVLILAPIVGHFVLHQLTASLHYIIIEPPNSFLNWANIFPSLMLFLEQMLVYLKDMTAVSIIVILALLSLILFSIRSLVLLFSTKSTTTLLDFVVFFICLASYAILLSPILAGNYTGFDTIRYNYHAFIVLTACLPLILLEFIPRLKQRLQPIGVGASIIVIGLTIYLSFAHRLNFEGYFNYYPQEAKNADIFYKKTGLKYGTSEYWDAKIITMFSKHNVRVFSSFDDLSPYLHVTNKTWFHNHSKKNGGKPIEFEFTILDSDVRKEGVRKWFENYKDSIVKINNQEFMVLPRYTYTKLLKVKANP